MSFCPRKAVVHFFLATLEVALSVFNSTYLGGKSWFCNCFSLEYKKYVSFIIATKKHKVGNIDHQKYMYFSEQQNCDRHGDTNAIFSRASSILRSSILPRFIILAQHAHSETFCPNGELWVESRVQYSGSFFISTGTSNFWLLWYTIRFWSIVQK